MVDTNLRAEHWFEIEKHFDQLAAANTNRSAEIISRLGIFAKGDAKIEGHLKELINESIDAFDMYRTISAIAAKARRECEKNA